MEARINMAKKIIDGAHYKSEQVFPFESFATKCIGAYQTLEECGCSKPEPEKVDDLIEKVPCLEANTCLALMNICMDHVTRNSLVVNIMFKSQFLQGKKQHYVTSMTDTNKHFQRVSNSHGCSFQGYGHGYGHQGARNSRRHQKTRIYTILSEIFTLCLCF
jgi:hypothetical protein